MNQEQTEADGLLGRPPFILGLSGATAFVLYALLCPDALASGDPAVYLDQMVAQRFGGRTVHLGYLWLGAAYVWLFPTSDLAFNLLHAFMAAVAVMLVGGIAAQLTQTAGPSPRRRSRRWCI